MGAGTLIHMYVHMLRVQYGGGVFSAMLNFSAMQKREHLKTFPGIPTQKDKSKWNLKSS